MDVAQTPPKELKEDSTQQSDELSQKEPRPKPKSKVQTAERIPSSKRRSKSGKKRGTKEKERSKEVDELPKTAGSVMSPAPNPPKFKPPPSTPAKTNQTSTPVPTSKDSTGSKSKKSDEVGRALTPGVPGKNSKAMAVETEQKSKESKVEKKEEIKKKTVRRETNFITYKRPGINKNVEVNRKKQFEEELKQFETGEFTYSTDPTRYRFRSTPSFEIVIRIVPWLLVFAIMLATTSCLIFLTKEPSHEMEFDEMSEMTLIQYDSLLVVDSIFDYLRNETVLRENNCPGLVQGFFKPVYESTLLNLKRQHKNVTNAMKAVTYRWVTQTEQILNMNFDCPPSILIEMRS
ncbi:LEM domain-containing protein [Caenorhabditis elegans]|uniref:LEM domain-containing protein n=1 Tax=Caenorhabditis elegans TaxID=6239 RepID=Q9TZI8_CAEEL|nr:LEM domain-containing protein [Caenorhabditis elegans]CCD70781.1 LEM domain-containing protein [Caenorhabditis elegans]|eukprot:NP_490858.3 Uncharacterized protein CELE_F47G6.3 [Caenorhabditis elegans]